MCLLDKNKPRHNTSDKPRWKESNDGKFTVMEFVDQSVFQIITAYYRTK